MTSKTFQKINVLQNQYRRRLFMAGAGFALAGLLPTSSLAASSDVTVRIAPLFAYNYLTLGHKSGGIENTVNATGGKVEWKPYFPAYAPAAEALRGGSVDISSGSATSFLTSASADKDLVVFAVEKNDGKDQGIVATAKSGIQSLDDLRDKKIAVNKGGTGEYLLRLALAKQGIPVNAVQVVYLGPTDAATAFAQGHVDAWAIWDQFFAAAQTEPGAKVIAYASDLGSLNRNVHVTTRKFAQQHPEQLKAIYKALVNEVDTSKQNPGRVAELSLQAGVPKPVAEVIRKFTIQEVVPADEQFRKELETLSDFYASQKLSPSRIDVSETVVDVSRP